MRLSEKREMDLYSAIADTLVDLRIKLKTSDSRIRMIKSDELDKELFDLDMRIWKKVKKALNLTGGQNE